MRIQPFHFGHAAICNAMIAECDVAILAIGSSQYSNSAHNPWTFDQRKEMVKRIYGDRIKIIPVRDLDSNDKTTDWCDYVIEKIDKLHLPTPTEYYTGSVADSIWYRSFFNKINMVDRSQNTYPSATDIRTSLSLNDDTWKQWVPRVNHLDVETTFPQHLKMEK